MWSYHATAFARACQRCLLFPQYQRQENEAVFGGELERVAGTISKKMEPAVKTLYDQMPEPKWVIAMGNCAISGGPFVFEGQYGIVEGADKFLPVDIYIPGCPPRPEALIEGILELEEKVTGFRRWPRVEAK